jgi:hypothetical protein
MYKEFQGDILLKWDSGTEPPIDKIEEIERIVTIDIRESLGSLDNPGDLVFHTVFLGDPRNNADPIVSVYGDENDPEHFYCVYTENPAWRSLFDLEKEEQVEAEVKKVLDFVNAKSVDNSQNKC